LSAHTLRLYGASVYVLVDDVAFVERRYLGSAFTPSSVT